MPPFRPAAGVGVGGWDGLAGWRPPRAGGRGRLTVGGTKGAAEQQQQLAQLEFRRSAAGEGGAEEHLPTLTPLARSLAANTALARSRSSSAVAAGGQSPESRED